VKREISAVPSSHRFSSLDPHEAGMPFIHIKSLPFNSFFDASLALEGITKDFAKETGTGLEHVTATWDFLPPGHYAVAGKAASRQPRRSHPILVDLLAPDLNSAAEVEKMIAAVAASISKRARVPVTNIFVNHRQARPGRVFDAGGIVRW
jgi:phenylpyruvate tautomerase PptA (4-oxalocrotonate tautomerase family)